MNMKRRTFLKSSLAVGAVGATIGIGLLTPRAVLAAWPKSAFEARTVDDALTALTGNAQLTGSNKIHINAPDIAENGAMVSVSVTTSIPDVKSISIIAEKNLSPLVASFNLDEDDEGFVKTRIKMGKTSSVIAVIKAGGKLYSTGKQVKVTVGGCGG